MKTVLAPTYTKAATACRVVFPRCRLPRVASVLVLLFSALTGALRAASAGESGPLRFGFSSQVFSEVNESDARAALKIWAQTLGAERGIPVDPAVKILAGTEAIKDALLERKIDAATMTTMEFWTLRGEIPTGPMILGLLDGETTEEYLLLVHRDNPAVRPADLRGQNVNILQGARASLAAVWMETLLLEAKLGTVATFWGNTTHTGKLSRVVLPVFFRQVDACVVTRSGFRTLCELNPQVGRQLKILAQSEALVPTIFIFRGGMVSPNADKLIAEINQIGRTIAGRQTLTLFQSGELVVRPVSDLDPACALLDRHQRLLAEAGKSAGARTGVPAPPDDSGRSR